MTSKVHSDISKTLEEIREHKGLLLSLFTKLSREANIRKVASLNLQIGKEENLIYELKTKVERLREHLTERSYPGSRSKSKSRSRSRSKKSFKKYNWMGSRMFPVIKPDGKIIEPDPLIWSSFVYVPSILDGGNKKIYKRF